MYVALSGCQAGMAEHVLYLDQGHILSCQERGEQMPDTMKTKRFNLGLPALSLQPVLPVPIGKTLLADKHMIPSIMVFLAVLQEPFSQ